MRPVIFKMEIATILFTENNLYVYCSMLRMTLKMMWIFSGFFLSFILFMYSTYLLQIIFSIRQCVWRVFVFRFCIMNTLISFSIVCSVYLNLNFFTAGDSKKLARLPDKFILNVLLKSNQIKNDIKKSARTYSS